MNYQDAQAKLLARVRNRIHNGELTERGLARQIGISQPHVHNVLKGVRNLSPEIFDSILEHFQMSLLDLAEAERIRALGWAPTKTIEAFMVLREPMAFRMIESDDDEPT